MHADLTGGIDDCLVMLLLKAKKKLDKCAAILIIEDLHVKYN